jgi:hypothetical protein
MKKLHEDKTDFGINITKIILLILLFPDYKERAFEVSSISGERKYKWNPEYTIYICQDQQQVIKFSSSLLLINLCRRAANI